jgi:diguanylate cyclase (GGDEF)-like protein/putative nucleotidyltransferase with HDIG domain
MGMITEATLLGMGAAVIVLWFSGRRGRRGGLTAEGRSMADYFTPAVFPALLMTVTAVWSLAARAYPRLPSTSSQSVLTVLALVVVSALVAGLSSARRGASQGPAPEGAVDPLTGISSHRAFQDRLAHECDRAFRFGDSFALGILDLDQFQSVNNRYRHHTGDRILHELAARLQAAIREIDLCARFAGDQFAVILPHTLHRGGLEAAERLRRVVSGGTFSAPDNNDIRLTATVGVSYYPTDGTNPPDLVEAAKNALIFAKSLGGNQIQLAKDVPVPASGSDNVVNLPTSGHGTVVRSLAAAVDVRDRYTHSHSQLVSELAAATARRVGLDDAEVERVKVGALLHDVGKIGVPDAVLSKEGTLSPEDWASIREHPRLGKTIIEQAPELKDVVPLVLHHQERFDGQGYPSRLQGEAIPLGARIIAAADAYHAIRSERPYRSGRTHAEAVTELRRCAGAQFDPRVVSAFVDTLEHDTVVQRLISTLDPAGGAAAYPGHAPYGQAATVS